MTEDSAAMALRHWRNNSPRLFISLDVLGNSQSKSIPSKPNVRATSIVEFMKAARAVALEAIIVNNVELLPAPPIDRRVVAGGVLVLKVLVKIVNDVV